MQLIQQPVNSKVCGQACVAMARGCTLEEAVGKVGRGWRSTQTKDLVKGLRDVFRCPSRLRKITPKTPLPARAVVKLSFRGKRGWHWVLWWDGRVYDPYPYQHPPRSFGVYSSFLDLTLT